MSKYDKPITTTTRAQARRFREQFESQLTAELDYYLTSGRMAEGKFLELFSIEKSELKPRFADFIRAMSALENGGAPDAQAIQDGLDIVAGMVRITGNPDGMAPHHAQRKTVEKTFRKRNELGYAPLTPRDEHIIKETVQERGRLAAELEQDAAQWKDAVRHMVEIAKGVGIDAQPYVDGLGLSRLQE